MSEADFNPIDMEELGKRFDQIIKDNGKGYVVEFHISTLAARDMIREWLQHVLGDPDATYECLQNYGYIVTQILEQMEKDNDI